MFLIRAAFWLSVVILFIPADPQAGTPPPRVSAIETLIAARTAVADMSGFCDRNPDACTTGGAAFRLFVDKAENGARMVYEYLQKTTSKSDPQGTLTREDVAPAWHGPRAAGNA
jgi:Family of unknown function (DUF5330)